MLTPLQTSPATMFHQFVFCRGHWLHTWALKCQRLYWQSCHLVAVQLLKQNLLWITKIKTKINNKMKTNNVFYISRGNAIKKKLFYKLTSKTRDQYKTNQHRSGSQLNVWVLNLYELAWLCWLEETEANWCANTSFFPAFSHWHMGHSKAVEILNV